jgi:transposase-like protein
MPEEKPERNAAIRLAFSQGHSYRAIAAAYDLTPQRVRQIVDPATARARRREQRRRRAAARAGEAT